MGLLRFSKKKKEEPHCSPPSAPPPLPWPSDPVLQLALNNMSDTNQTSTDAPVKSPIADTFMRSRFDDPAPSSDATFQTSLLDDIFKELQPSTPSPPPTTTYRHSTLMPESRSMIQITTPLTAVKNPETVDTRFNRYSSPNMILSPSTPAVSPSRLPPTTLPTSLTTGAVKPSVTPTTAAVQTPKSTKQSKRGSTLDSDDSDSDGSTSSNHRRMPRSASRLSIPKKPHSTVASESGKVTGKITAGKSNVPVASSKVLMNRMRERHRQECRLSAQPAPTAFSRQRSSPSMPTIYAPEPSPPAAPPSLVQSRSFTIAAFPARRLVRSSSAATDLFLQPIPQSHNNPMQMQMPPDMGMPPRPPSHFQARSMNNRAMPIPNPNYRIVRDTTPQRFSMDEAKLQHLAKSKSAYPMFPYAEMPSKSPIIVSAPAPAPPAAMPISMPPPNHALPPTPASPGTMPYAADQTMRMQAMDMPLPTKTRPVSLPAGKEAARFTIESSEEEMDQPDMVAPPLQKSKQALINEQQRILSHRHAHQSMPPTPPPEISKGTPSGPVQESSDAACTPSSPVSPTSEASLETKIAGETEPTTETSGSVHVPLTRLPSRLQRELRFMRLRRSQYSVPNLAQWAANNPSALPPLEDPPLEPTLAGPSRHAGRDKDMSAYMAPHDMIMVNHACVASCRHPDPALAHTMAMCHASYFPPNHELLAPCSHGVATSCCSSVNYHGCSCGHGGRMRCTNSATRRAGHKHSKKCIHKSTSTLATPELKDMDKTSAHTHRGCCKKHCRPGSSSPHHRQCHSHHHHHHNHCHNRSQCSSCSRHRHHPPPPPSVAPFPPQEPSLQLDSKIETETA
ncbi:uncharacterized protein BYT42DRAFT_647011 [Radiomyces spectabilis]|uniref:uncharacterized protein n=1 Tax=Radiomyces spectabilis TaxID=64574 RepID=UPI0022206EE1|nr:uncharacterized protein BYT42DRAFT_647011 [Radiomyces spectabilis]KAI8373065.1 hypothetical protein BYT42DRAFT_647011 [Radiomyces spectabilis]